MRGCFSGLSSGAVGLTVRHSTVCIKAVNDVTSVYSALIAETPSAKKQATAEKAVEKHCAKKLSTKDNKLCYFLEPLKKDVARQVTYGKDPLKVCKSLEKKNPDFCSMRYRTL